jgi:hypothetical protein
MGVAADASGNVIVTGFFEGAADFGGDTLICAGGEDIFVAKYDASGAHQWSQRLGSTAGDQGLAVAVDGSGDVIVTGRFEGTVDFGGGDLTSAGGSDIFVAKYSDAVGTGATAPQLRALLYQNVPNPFNPQTTIGFNLPETAGVWLSIYDLTGRHVSTLVNGDVPAGEHRIRWDGRDGNGDQMASGVYLYQLRAGSFVETKRMVLLK